MADQIVRAQKLYVGGRDLSSDWTSLVLRAGREPIDFTKGGAETRVNKSGLFAVAFEADGVVDLGADLVEDELYNAVENLSDVPIIVAPRNTGVEGDPAYAMLANVGDFSPMADANVGDRLNFRVSARASRTSAGAGRLVRGTIMEDAQTARTATGSGTGRQLGAVASGKKLYACLQVLSASASDTLDVTIGSDVDNLFASEATQVTFAQKTAAGQYEWVEVDGPITDEWFRVNWTIGGASPSFSFVVVLAIR